MVGRVMYESMRAWLALSLAPGIGAATWRKLRNHFTDIQQLEQRLLDAMAGDRSLARESRLLTPSQLAACTSAKNLENAEKTLGWMADSPEHHLISPACAAYPTALSVISDPPRMLYARGRLEALKAPHAAIIGARKASRYGQYLASDLAGNLSRCGLNIVSGLALGIDAAAHEGSLSQNGLTIAFAATSVDRVYPRAHAALASRIVEQGLVVSEFAFGSKLQRHCFPRRNRLISGLCPGVVVIEAALPSGSLTTAMHALKQGREVMAVPGSPTQTTSRGCHALIREGATLVENHEQVLQCLHKELRESLDDVEKITLSVNNPERKTVDNNDHCNTPVDPTAQALIEELAASPLTADELALRLQWPMHRVLANLAALEVSGHLNQERGGRYASSRSTGIGTLANKRQT